MNQSNDYFIDATAVTDLLTGAEPRRVIMS